MSNPYESSDSKGLASHFNDWRFCVAPMLDWTDRHCRYFHRQLSRHARLYTEMITTGALLHGKGDYLAYNESEHPIAVQLGGHHNQDLAKAAKLAEARGYDEVNLNLGCPSARVQNGRFGASLMKEPLSVINCLNAMHDAVSIPVTVKMRLGVDEYDSYDFIRDFIGEISLKSGTHIFIIHARKAWLSGLNPKENREIPPLNYERVYQIKRDFPDLKIILNGGIASLLESKEHLNHVDGVMLGRKAYQDPYLLAGVDSQLFGEKDCAISAKEVIKKCLPYFVQELEKGTRLATLTRHILGLFNGQRGARAWRRSLSENAIRPGADIDVVERALLMIEDSPQYLQAKFEEKM